MLSPRLALLRWQSRREMRVHHRAAVTINQLAGEVHSLPDARNLVDAIAAIFAADTPAFWTSESVRSRVAYAEYQSVAHSTRAFTEQRVADAWNEYVGEIGASEETRVTAPELHYLRDSLHTTARLMWTRKYLPVQTFWTIPQIYATDPDGKLAPGCRAMEALRLLYDMHRIFGNLLLTRERMRKGILLSDSLNSLMEHFNAPGEVSARVVCGGPNKICATESQFVREHGAGSLHLLRIRWFEKLFPASA